MNLFPASEAPPSDFVAFLAQRGGLSPEAAQRRLERWFGEYHATSIKQAPSAATGHAVAVSVVTS